MSLLPNEIYIELFKFVVDLSTFLTLPICCKLFYSLIKKNRLLIKFTKEPRLIRSSIDYLTLRTVAIFNYTTKLEYHLNHYHHIAYKKDKYLMRLETDYTIIGAVGGNTKITYYIQKDKVSFKYNITTRLVSVQFKDEISEIYIDVLTSKYVRQYLKTIYARLHI